MKKIIALCGCLWALCAGATNITNYPVRVNFNSNYWFLLSDVAAQTNWNLPGNYVASTADLNSLSNTLYQIVTNLSAGTATNVLLLDQVSTKIEDLQDRVFPSDTDRLPLATDNDGSTPYTNYYTSIVEIRKKLSIITNNTFQVYSNAYFYYTNFVNVEYTTNLTVIDGLTNLSLTPNTVLKADANKRITSIANGGGVLTNNGTGTFGWIPVSLLSVTNPPDSYFTNLYTTNIYAVSVVASNAFFTNLWASNVYIANLWATNAYINTLYATNIFTQQIKYYTNSGTLAPDFGHGYDALTIDSNFTFLAPINTDSGGKFAETTVKMVENSTGSAITATPFANCIVISNSYMGVGANGATWFTFVRYGTQRTNVYANAETR